MPGTVFAVSVIAYFVTGILCIALPPEATSKFDGHVIPDNAKCLRATRHANYASIDLAIGSPVNLLNMLLRLDIVKNNNDSAVRLFSNRVAESNSVACDGTLCSDVALLHARGPSSPQERSVVQFEYTNPTTESLSYGTAVTIELDGEFALKHGNDYFLTSTHLCWSAAAELPHNGAESDSEDNEGAVSVTVSQERLFTTTSGLQMTSTTRNTPTAQAERAGVCQVGNIAMFPGEAASEATWLGLASDRVYENTPDNVDDRRVVVEVGTACATNYTDYSRAYSLYQLDCLSAYVSCDVLPSVPYRRFASDQLRIHLPENTTQPAYVFASFDPRLSSLPKLDESGHAMYLSVLKLALMTLAAAVTWIRASKTTASHDRLFMFCLRMAHCPVLKPEELNNIIVWEDAAIGLMAIIARVGVATWRIFTLSIDNQLRAPVAQLAAGALSLLQWIIRYFVLQRECEAPLTKLGGSTALIDATCAVMLGFAEVPLLQSSLGRFDPTARLLTALLITTMTLQRSLFSTACCAMLYAVASNDARKSIRLDSLNTPAHGFDAMYVPFVLFGLVAWMLQTASIAILMADIFCVPLAHSVSRNMEGGWGEIAMAIFAAAAAASLPTMMRTLHDIAEDPVRKDPDESQ